MALVNNILRKYPQKRGRIHHKVDAEYFLFRRDGEKVFQMNTYRRVRGEFDNPKQEIQFDSKGIAELRRILEEYDNFN